MAKREKQCYCGVGGQAVLDGIMMKNKTKCAVAIRKADGTIDISRMQHKSLSDKLRISGYPFFRGMVNFIDSMMLGTKALNHSADIALDDIPEEPDMLEKFFNKVFGEKAKDVLLTCTMIISVIFAIALFMVLPYGISSLIGKIVKDNFLLSVIEAVTRMTIFIAYVGLVGKMKEIQVVYMYHGAEHKCISCIERGKPLTVDNVMRSSRLHPRCGTSFMLYVMAISCVLFFFIAATNPIHRLVVRLLLLPIIAGISYEIISWAGKSNNIIVRLLSKPGLALQKLTTKEPTPDMVEVAIAATEAVFDWEAYLENNFDYVREEQEEALEDVVAHEISDELEKIFGMESDEI
ncbi:MAG: DUF1385 domain-containing protein [Lachnospiraceae bacterium]